ncbi:putative TMEM14 family protein [Helianthus anomalus]
MHEIFFMIPYGMIVFCGGLIGFARKRVRRHWLVVWLLSQTKEFVVGLILETVCARALTWVMGQQYDGTAKIKPTGLDADIIPTLEVRSRIEVAGLNFLKVLNSSTQEISILPMIILKKQKLQQSESWTVS